MSLYLGENKIADNTCSRNIGEIIQSTIPLTDAGLHLLDGALISSAGSYAKFVNYIAGLVTDYPDLFVSESDWQSAVTTYGVCGKFVYDSTNNTVRLPKITGFTEGTTDVTALGDLIEAGLPNITGSFDGRGNGNGTSGWGGALVSKGTGVFNVSYKTGTNSAYGVAETNNTVHYDVATFNASNSNPIYGKSSTVQPQSIKVLYYIVIANSTVTISIENLDVTEVGKAFVDLFYPVGSVYVGVTSTCPLASVKGTWELVSSGRVLQGADSNHAAGTTIEAGLPNIEGTLSFHINGNGGLDVISPNQRGLFQATGEYNVRYTGPVAGGGLYNGANFNASRVNSIYGNSNTVQPPAYIVNIWKRTA